MTQNIIIGRDEADRKKFGDQATILLGKHYVKMGQTVSLSNNIYIDVARSHVLFVVGKRGSGKSYTMGVIAEGISDAPPDVSQNISVLILDTMGIYWTMKYENRKDEDLLKEWNLEGKGLDVKIYTPIGYYNEYQEAGIPTDYPFAIKPSELTAEDWCNTFETPLYEPIGLLIGRAVMKCKGDYTIDEIIDAADRDLVAESRHKNAVKSMFSNAKLWGLFDVRGTKIGDLIKGGQVSVLDVSCYATSTGGWAVKGMAIGLIAKKLFNERMESRKKEELDAIQHGYSYLGEIGEETKEQKPLVWIVIDEAHEFLPEKGKNAATDALITLLREGRQPGISLILASQQPGKVHSDVLTQSDCVIAHKITAKRDIDALNAIMQSYMTKGLTDAVNDLPKEKGAAVILDDNVERIYPMRVRPRLTWHGGEAPSALKVSRKKLELNI